MQQIKNVDAQMRQRADKRAARYRLVEQLLRLDHNTIIGAAEIGALLNRSENTVNQWCVTSPQKLPPRIQGHGRAWRLGTALDWIAERDQQGRKGARS